MATLEHDADSPTLTSSSGLAARFLEEALAAPPQSANTLHPACTSGGVLFVVEGIGRIRVEKKR